MGFSYSLPHFEGQDKFNVCLLHTGHDTSLISEILYPEIFFGCVWLEHSESEQVSFGNAQIFFAKVPK